MSRETLDIVQWVLTLVSIFCACMAFRSSIRAIKYAECARQWVDSALLTSRPIVIVRAHGVGEKEEDDLNNVRFKSNYRYDIKEKNT